MELFFGCFMVFVCIRGHELRSDEDKGKWEARFGRHHRGRRREGTIVQVGKAARTETDWGHSND